MPLPGRRRLRWLLVCLSACLAVWVGLLGWYGWRWYKAPVVPEISVGDADPDLARAVEEARRHVKQKPYSAERWGDLGKLLRGAGMVEEAADCFAQAERLAPENPLWPYLRGEALLLRDAEAALPPLRRAAALWGRDGEVDNVAPWLRLGEALLAAGEEAEAEENLRRAERAAPDDPSVLLNLGFLAYARDDLEGSKRYLMRCRNSLFTQQRACARLAVICRRLGEKAAADFDARAAELPADRGWVDPLVAECLAGAVGKVARFRRADHFENQGRYRDAAMLLRELAEQGGDIRAYVGLGRNLGRLGDDRGAERALREALRLAPENIPAHYQLALLEWARAEQAQGQADKARERALQRCAAAARQVLQSKQDHGQAHALLGRCLKRLGQRSEAQTELRLAIKCRPDLADPYLYLGEMLAEDGSVEKARSYLEQAQRLAGPGDVRPRAALERLHARKPRN